MSEDERYPSEDVFKFGSRYMVEMQIITASDRGQKLESLMAQVDRAGNFAMVSWHDILQYRRNGRLGFTVAADSGGLTSTLTLLNSFDGDGDGMIKDGDYFTINGEVHVCTRDVVGSAVVGRRQLTLNFEPNLRKAVTANTVLDLDSVVNRLKIPYRTRNPLKIMHNNLARGPLPDPWRWKREVRIVLEEPEQTP